MTLKERKISPMNYVNDIGLTGKEVNAIDVIVYNRIISNLSTISSDAEISMYNMNVVSASYDGHAHGNIVDDKICWYTHGKIEKHMYCDSDDWMFESDYIWELNDTLNMYIRSHMLKDYLDDAIEEVTGERPVHKISVDKRTLCNVGDRVVYATQSGTSTGTITDVIGTVATGLSYRATRTVTEFNWKGEMVDVTKTDVFSYVDINKRLTFR